MKGGIPKTRSLIFNGCRGLHPSLWLFKLNVVILPAPVADDSETRSLTTVTPLPSKALHHGGPYAPRQVPSTYSIRP